VPICKENVGMVGVEKHQADNLTNVPQARLIENVWALLARAVYAKRWEEKNKAELCGTIKRKLKEIEVSVVKTMDDERRSNKATQNS
jgi:hypothetical protein